MIFLSKLRNLSSVLLPILGIVIISSMIGLMIFWETKGRELYLYCDVIVLKEDVKRGTIITPDMITVVKMQSDNLINNPITNENDVIGFAAKHFIPKNLQLHKEFFEIPELVTKNNEFIFRIPNDWIYSVPSTLRRKDKVIFYSVNADIGKKTISGHEGEIATYDPTEKINISDMQPVFSTIVAYVKDSANRELVTVSKEDRLDGSSTLSEIDVIITLDNLKQLENIINNGSKFIIMYDEGANI